MGVIQRARFKKELTESQWFPLDKLRELQLDRVKALVSHAYENVPFYKRRLQASGLEPSQLQTLGDLKKIPPISKEELRNTSIEALIPNGIELSSLRKIGTSGTTGPSLWVYFDQTAIAWRQACTDRTREAIHFDPWDRDAILHFSSMSKKDPSMGQRMKSWFLARRRRYIRPFYFTFHCEEILPELISFKPVVLEGQPAYLRDLKRALIATSSEMKLKMLVSSGDLLDASTVKELEAYFQCPVYEVYGAQDVGPLAWQCPEREGFHLNPEVQYLECLDEAGKECAIGEAGQLAVTCLDNYSFPMIRYKVGDVVTFSDSVCKCGRTLPLLKRIEGRYLDFITLPLSGRRVPPQTIVSALREIPELPSFQLVCTSKANASLRFFSKALSQETMECAAAKCSGLFDGELLVQGERIEQEPRAKIRAVVPFQEAVASL